jgi:putative intracellular protease/amidase
MERGRLRIDNSPASAMRKTQAGFAGNAPWLLEDRLRISGARYIANSPWTPHVVIDGNLVTGQQNYSAGVTADAVLKQLAVAA